jgi:DNA-directed RNA polymerase specialized sigma24 family protein
VAVRHRAQALLVDPAVATGTSPLDFERPTEGLTGEVERRAELRDLLRDLRELPDDQRPALLLSQAPATCLTPKRRTWWYGR